MTPILLAVSQAVAPAPVTVPAVAPLPPANWSNLPELRYQRRWPMTAELSAFVRGEVETGRCTAGGHGESGYVLRVELVVLVAGTGQLRRIVPRAIDCVTIEQYASGLVERMARDNVDMASATAEGWHRTAITFAWDR